MDKVYQSAKVYVIDFHFESKDKEAIAKMKKELNQYFIGLKKYLDDKYDRTVIRQIFLRVH